MSDKDKVALPGDADEPAAKTAGVLKQARARKEDSTSTRDAAATSDTLDAAQDVTKDTAKGPLSTAQHDDDGWGDTPVQMRGE